MPVLPSTQTRTGNDVPLYVPMDGEGNAIVSGGLVVDGLSNLLGGLSIPSTASSTLGGPTVIGSSGVTGAALFASNGIYGGGSVVGPSFPSGLEAPSTATISLRGPTSVGTAGVTGAALFADNGIYGGGLGVSPSFPSGLSSASFTNSTVASVPWAYPQTGISTGFVPNSTLLPADVAPLSNFSLLALKIAAVQVADATSGGQSLNLFITACPTTVANSTGAISDMAVYSATSNGIQVQYIGNFDNAGTNLGPIVVLLPYTSASWPATGLSVFVSSSAGGVNTTFTATVVGVI